jgi:DNA polymerase/3'-5' exonuclease PolX
MLNAVLSALFDQMADVMEILGEDRFRINSYRKVARIIGELPTDVENLLTDGQLAKVPGIGKSSLAKIEEFINTGTITAHQELLKKIPPDLLELLKVPGVGPKGVKAVYEQLKVTSIAELKTVIEDGSLAELPGFGEKKAAAIERGIEFLEKSKLPARCDAAPRPSETLTYSLPRARAKLRAKQGSKSYRPSRAPILFRKYSLPARRKVPPSLRLRLFPCTSMSAWCRRKVSERRHNISPAPNSITFDCGKSP